MSLTNILIHNFHFGDVPWEYSFKYLSYINKRVKPRCSYFLYFNLDSSDMFFYVDQEYGTELRILSADPLQTECPKVVYLVRSQLNFMKFVANQIKNDESKGLQREYHLYFVPRRIVACEKVFWFLYILFPLMYMHVLLFCLDL